MEWSLVQSWADAASYEIASPALGRLRIRMQDSRSGSHTPRWFLLARGYEENPGEDLGCSTLYDIAPTILHSASVPQPHAMHGRPLLTRSVIGDAAIAK